MQTLHSALHHTLLSSSLLLPRTALSSRDQLSALPASSEPDTITIYIQDDANTCIFPFCCHGRHLLLRNYHCRLLSRSS